MGKPRVIGNYIIEGLLGHGNYGEVRSATHVRTKKRYAVKIVTCEFFNLDQYGMDVRREMSILMAMQHPNIIRLYEVCARNHELFLVMELATNGDLFSFINNCGALPEWRACDYFRQLLGAVTHCHSRGVYHRDLKPENILLTDTHQKIKLADFGFAAMVDSYSDIHPLLRTNCGSAQYCAPEIWNGTHIDGYDGSKADAFSCGVILYCMLVGGQPFYASSEDLILEKVNRCEFHVPSTVPPSACDLIERLLRKDPKKRMSLKQALDHSWMSSKSSVPSDPLTKLTEVGHDGDPGSTVDDPEFWKEHHDAI